MRIKRETFNFILGEISQKLILQPTDFKPFPTTPDKQLALTICRLAHRCSFSTLSDLFGVPRQQLVSTLIVSVVHWW